MADVHFTLVAMAFVRSAGGAVSVLFGVDQEGVPLFDGEPVLIVQHRPGADPDLLEVDVADALPPQSGDLVAERAGRSLVELVDGAFDRQGSFDGERLLGRGVDLVASADSFGAAAAARSE